MKASEIRLVPLTSIQLTHVHHNLDKMPAETQNSVVHTERQPCCRLYRNYLQGLLVRMA